MILLLLLVLSVLLYLLHMWFVEYLHSFLYFACGFINIFSKKVFTNHIISHIIKP